MAILTIEIPDKETEFVTEFLKKIGGKVKSIVDENSQYDPVFVAKGKTINIYSLKGHY